MRGIFISLLVFIFVLTFSFSVTAAPKPKKVSAGTLSVSAQQIKAKNVVRASFGGLKGVRTVSYTLMYDANGVGQGVMGSFSPGKKASIVKDMYLGTCSGKVCVKHKNVKNLQLSVTTKLHNGKSSSKTYKVK